MAPTMLYEVGYGVGKNISNLLAVHGRVVIKLETGGANTSLCLGLKCRY
jgi:hypothetical protein